MGDDPSGTRTGASHDAPVMFGWPSTGTKPTVADSVASLAANLAAHGRSANLVVALDRERADMDARTLVRLEELAARHEAEPTSASEFKIADLDDRRRFIESLPSFIDRDVASFALVPDERRRGPGYNRNYLLLSAAGGFLVMTDDDVLCDVRASRDVRISGDARTSRDVHAACDAPAFSSDPFPVPLRFFPDRDTALASVIPTDVDVVARHRALLGSSVEGHTGTVALTCAGCYGDSGFGRARTVLSLAGDDRDASFAFGYEHIRYSRELVRVPNGDLVGPSMFFMAGHGGCDAREVLPPYFPFVGNEDGFFAMLVRACRAGSLTAYPAFALRHEPENARALKPDSLTNAAPTVTDLMMSSLLLCMEGNRAGDSRDRMVSIGSGYVALASLKAVDFVESVHAAWSRGARAYAESLESLLDRYGRTPDLWAADVDATLESARELLREPALLFGPSGCGLDPDAMRALMASYGRTLEQWPDIFEFARGRGDSFGR